MEFVNDDLLEFRWYIEGRFVTLSKDVKDVNADLKKLRDLMVIKDVME